jgi:hypothetical protein
MPIKVCLTVEIVEQKGPISIEKGHGREVFDETCETWDKWTSQSGGPPFPRLHPGIQEKSSLQTSPHFPA